MKAIRLWLAILAFAAFVWPTPWRWVIGDQGASVIRINRITGDVQIFTNPDDTASDQDYLLDGGRPTLLTGSSIEQIWCTNHPERKRKKWRSPEE